MRYLTDLRIEPLFVALLSTLFLASCFKDENLKEDPETPQNTVVQGVVYTSGGLPVKDLRVKLLYLRTISKYSSDYRYKAEGKTDGDGKFRLHFYVDDDEQRELKSKNPMDNYPTYQLTYDLSSLDANNYFVPSDFQSEVTSYQPPQAHPASVPLVEQTYFRLLKRSATYNDTLYIPMKRKLKVTLKNFVPRQVGKSYDQFEVINSIPYGIKGRYGPMFPGTNYSHQTTGELLYVLYDRTEQTFEVPVALHEHNILTLHRKKNGQFTSEHLNMFVTETDPPELTFSY